MDLITVVKHWIKQLKHKIDSQYFESVMLSCSMHDTSGNDPRLQSGFLMTRVTVTSHMYKRNGVESLNW